MKKFICIIIIVYIFISLVGCSVDSEEHMAIKTPVATASNITATSVPTENQSSEAETSLWYEKIDFEKTNTHLCWSDVVVEKSGVFYYAADDGLYKYNPETENDILLVKGYVKNLILYKENIYYSTKDAVYIFSEQAETSSLIWEKSMLSEQDDSYYEIFDFMLTDKYMYIACQINRMVRFDLKTKDTEWMLKKTNYIGSFNYFVSQDEYYYYIPYRSFQIHRADYVTNEAIMARGDTLDLDDENKILYDGLEAANGEMYYYRRVADDIFKYNENGEDELIYKLPEGSDGVIDILHSQNNDKLYFALKNNDLYTVSEYDGGSEIVKVLENVGFASYDTISITESAIFWLEETGEDATKVCMKLR